MRPISLLGIATAFGLCVNDCPAGDGKPGKPNVIVIMSDDMGYECLSCNGSDSYKTPQLDKLAETGIRFDQCHVQPLCTPTRVQLMTGQFNIRNYVRFGLLPTTETSFGNSFSKAGYVTGVCGKWQLGQDPELPKHFGFDESYLWQLTRRPPRYANPGLEINGKEVDFRNGEYGPKLVNDFALDFVTRHKDEPFFLYYPMMLTHSPFQPTPDSPNWDPTAMGEMVNNNPKHFKDMVEYCDKMVGRLVQKLDELEIRDNTLVIFFGDNGTLPRIVTQFRGKDYQGGKGTTTARGTHVPCVASWPARIKPGVNTDLISSVDFYPTICEAAGIPVPQGIDGVSFYPQLIGEKGQPREWVYCWYSPRQQQKPKMDVKEFAFDHHFKLYRSGQFFDLRTDPFEQKPLKADDQSGEAGAAVDKLQAVLDRFANARPPELDKLFAERAKKP